LAHQLADAVRSELAETQAALSRLQADSALHDAVVRVAQACVDALKAGRKLLFAGNGGSAADCQHIAAEFISRFSFDRPALAGLALTTDTSVLTAIGNDYGYENVFSRQVAGLGVPGDVFFGFTTSGTSPNILEALRVAKAAGLMTVGVTGLRGASLAEACDHCLVAPADETPKVQELHIVLGHVICGLCEQIYFQA